MQYAMVDNYISAVLCSCQHYCFYNLKLSLIIALSGTSYSLFRVLALGLGMSKLLKSMPQEMLAENVLGRSEGILVIFSLMAITGVL